MSATSDSKPAKRRVWGKPRERDKVVYVDQMEIELLSDASGTDANLNMGESHCSESKVVDLQRPELMANYQLVASLKEMRVPLPDPAGGEQSRERLLYLFKKHVMPRPQRNRLTGKRRRHQLAKAAGDGGTRDDAMEWVTATRREDGGDDWSEDTNRKRLHINVALS